MKKILIFLPVLFGLAFAGSALAEWEQVALTGDGQFYVESSSVRTIGKNKEAWVMLNLKSSQKATNGKRYLSAKAKVVFDCVNDKKSYLALVYYSGKMGTGNVVVDDNFKTYDWYHNVPDSAFAIVARAVCS